MRRRIKKGFINRKKASAVDKVVARCRHWSRECGAGLRPERAVGGVQGMASDASYRIVEVKLTVAVLSVAVVVVSA